MSKWTDRRKFRRHGPTDRRGLPMHVMLLILALAAAAVILLGADSAQPEMEAWASE